jgi:FkbM family methyltransferase
MLRGTSDFRVSPDHLIECPLYTDNVWDDVKVREYEIELVSTLAAEAARLPRPLTIVDCGASFGLMSTHLAIACKPEALVAFEPNTTMQAILSRNVKRLELPAKAHNLAVSNFCGRGALMAPARDCSADAKFLSPAAEGNIRVTTLDAAVQTTDGLLIKIDVEGGEMGVLQGAVRLIRQSKAVCIAFEAHPEVFARTGIDPSDCIRQLRSVRAVTARIAESPHIEIKPDIPFFDQVSPTRVYNIVCRG